MEVLILAFVILSGIAQCALTYYLIKKSHKLYMATSATIVRRIDAIFVMDKPQENQATQEDPNMVDLGEDTVVPAGVKFEVEGGETQVPPGHEEQKS